MDGQKIGQATGVDVSEQFRQEPIAVLDLLTPEDFAIVGYSVSLTVRVLRIPNESLVQRNLWPAADADADTFRQYLIDFPPMEFEIMDSVTNTVVYKVTHIKPAQRNCSIQPNGLVFENCQFVGLQMGDEGSPNF